MKPNYLSFCAVFMAAAMNFVSCQEKDPQGVNKPEDPATVVADVFFSAENGDYCYYVGKNGSADAELVVVRENSTVADEYAIKVLSADKGVEIPETVSFKEGETQTVIVVSGPSDGKTGDIFSFEIMFTGDNVNPSANSVVGTTRCEGSFYFYEEMTAAACFLPWGDTGDIFNYMGDMKQIVWKLDDANYIFRNFLGSKYDLKVIIDTETNLIKNITYGYELYSKVDEYGGTTYYFYNEQLEELKENEGWEDFAPKGDRRVISGLTFYIDPAQTYSAFAPASGDSAAYFYFASPSVYFYSEQDEIDKEFSNWQYFCVYLYPEDKLAKCDFVGFPEVEKKLYPDPVYSEDSKDGKMPFQFYLDYEQIYLDTQYAVKTDKGYYFEDFMKSETNLTIIPSGSTFSIEVTNAAGDVLSNTVSDGYRYLGMEYIFPWASNEYWCIYGMYMYNDSAYTGWDEANKSAWFYGSYNIYNGDAGAYIGNVDGYVYIYW